MYDRRAPARLRELQRLRREIDAGERRMAGLYARRAHLVKMDRAAVDRSSIDDLCHAAGISETALRLALKR